MVLIGLWAMLTARRTPESAGDQPADNLSA
jgi:hypothetical protein